MAASARGPEAATNGTEPTPSTRALNERHLMTAAQHAEPDGHSPKDLASSAVAAHAQMPDNPSAPSEPTAGGASVPAVYYATGSPRRYGALPVSEVRSVTAPLPAATTAAATTPRASRRTARDAVDQPRCDRHAALMHDRRVG